ncbi:hypothetical protein [Marinicella litoralis]|uniref:Uncharacterized protein n=1 Tax=Marinicella litoralis TaxID=644220 RepID=A0A4R6XW96_9GAMM|nr:hypothetical protein [Marinicella litoralis]TDR20758.1 hypothetical protein C8D91_1736 [Marinicella litoralis]
MPSSISNSEIESKDYYYHENRPIPDIHWKPAMFLAFLLMTLGLIAWEYNARVIWGYEPEAYIDNNGLWAIQRRLIDQGNENTVAIIGASRILFDFDLDTYESMTGTRPIQLALAGTNPRPILADLAKDEDFKGLLYVGITPGSFFRNGGGISAEAPEYYAKESPTQWMSQQISMLIEPHLAFYDLANWPLFTLIERIELPNREGVFDPRMGVWELSQTSKDRNTKMFWKVEDDMEYQHKAQMTWRGFMEMGDKRGPSEFDLDQYLAGVIKDVDSIRARGGDVIFIRLPSSGDYRPRENRLQPRAEYWERLLKDTQSIGVHFEDHETLQGFRIPEWSHLHSEDAPKFTAALIPLINEKLIEAGKPGILQP